ncbi:MAG TPA: cytochrome c [Terracidiphilus sp.]|nr:cytochrome c [Terracidiphilus sp.]
MQANLLNQKSRPPQSAAPSPDSVILSDRSAAQRVEGPAVAFRRNDAEPGQPTAGCPILAPSFWRKGGIPRTSISRALALTGFSALLLVAGCRQDMQDQPRMVPQRGSDVFADHRGARPQVLNTIARGQLHEDSYFYTGVVKGANGYREEQNLMPFPVTMQVLKRGQERFNIYCTPCHSRVGNGLGEIVQRGYKPAANLHDQVRTSQPISHYFYVMTHGYGAMPDYSAQLAPADRWAVAAYIRALQLSEAATPQDVPSGAQVQDLKSIAAGEGHPEYAQPWALPATGAQAYHPIASEGTPAMAPAYPADPKISIPATKPAPAAQK